MFGIIWDIYSFTAVWIAGPLALTTGTGWTVVKYAKRRKKKARVLPKYVSATGLTRKMDIGKVGSPYGTQVKVAVNVKTTLDDTLTQIVRREATGIFLTIPNQSIKFSYGGYTKTARQDVDIELTSKEADELQSILCHATIEQDQIGRGY